MYLREFVLEESIGLTCGKGERDNEARKAEERESLWQILDAS